MLIASACIPCNYLYVGSDVSVLPDACPRCGESITPLRLEEFSKQFGETFYSLNMSPVGADLSYLLELWSSREESELKQLIAGSSYPQQFVARLKQLE